MDDTVNVGPRKTEVAHPKEEKKYDIILIFHLFKKSQQEQMRFR